MVHKNSPAIQSVVIMGGGAAGWLTAAILASSAAVKARNVQITLIESPDVGILGVGEGTWPTMRDTLRKIGLDEATVIRQCDASFKQGTCFNQWHHTGTDDTYYHPFELPAGMFDTDPMAWWAAHRSNSSFAELFTAHPQLSQAAKAPKQPQTPDYAAVANYGYHLDAHKFANLLKQHCQQYLGVQLISMHVTDIISNESGDIHSLANEAQTVPGDLFVDCSGFSAQLIGQHFQIPLQDQASVLPNDSALAIQARYVSNETPIASNTHSTAHANGWLWDIALPHRKGVGCVYSSQYCDEATARATLLDYLERDTTTAPVDEADIRKLSFTPGYRKTPWVKNCVAIGGAAGFLEPLEASALVMIELAASKLAAQLPACRNNLAPLARQYNQSMVAKWQRIVDFLKLHYVLSDRRDSAYWRAVSNTSSASEQLNDWLCLWQHRTPNLHDFCYQDEIFPLASYWFILCGMNFVPQSTGNPDEQAQTWVQKNRQRSRQLLAGLPGNRQLIEHIIKQNNQG